MQNTVEFSKWCLPVFKTTDGLPVPNLQEQELDWITETKENIFSNEGMGNSRENFVLQPLN